MMMGGVRWSGLKQVRTALEGPCRRSVLAVGVLLAGVGDAVLGLTGARAQAVQSSTILCVVDVIFKEKLREKFRDVSQTAASPPPLPPPPLPPAVSCVTALMCPLNYKTACPQCKSGPVKFIDMAHFKKHEFAVQT